MTISGYFFKVKKLVREIAQLDEMAKMDDEKMKRIILNGLTSKCSPFIVAIQGWVS